MPRFLLLLAVFVVGCFPTAEAPARPDDAPVELSLASTEWPPFTDVEGKPRVATELVTRALEGAGIKATTNIISIDTWMEDIQKGTYSGSVAVWKSKEREAFLLFSQAYLENRLVVVASGDTDLDVKNFEDLSGKRVAIVKGYAYGAEVDNASAVTFVPGESTPKNLRDLLDGKVDYVLADALLAHHMRESHPDKDKLRVGNAALVSRGLYFAVRKKHPRAQEIITRFDARIDDMLADGSYNRILGVDWIVADADGDGKKDLILDGEKAGTSQPERGYNVNKPTHAGPRFKLEGGYYIDGKLYDSWESIPDTYKVEPTRVDAGVQLLEW